MTLVLTRVDTSQAPSRRPFLLDLSGLPEGGEFRGKGEAKGIPKRG